MKLVTKCETVFFELSYTVRLRCSARLRFIHSHMEFFAMHSWEIVALTTSGNRVRHIVSSQDDAGAGLLGR